MSPIQQMLLGAGGEPPEVVGQVLLTGEHRSGSSWTVPAGVTSISVVCIGPGAAAYIGNSGKSGGGGALAYANNIPVTPGATLTYITAVPDETDYNNLKAELSGPASGSQSAWTLTANGGQASAGGTRSATGNPGSVTSGTPTGGDGGDGFDVLYCLAIGGRFYPGGGGGGGYGGDGGDGASGNCCNGWGCSPTALNGSDGSNGGGGGGGRGKYPGGNDTAARGGGGGGTAPYGQGSNGSGGVSNHYGSGNSVHTTANGATGQGGSYVSGLSGGTPTNNTDQTVAKGTAGDYGGGAGTYTTYDPGAAELFYPIPGEACVRIIWPGTSRQFPSTRTANE